MRHFLSRLSPRIETRTLIVLLLVAAALWAFAVLASEMTEGELDAFDRMLLLALRNPADPADPLGPPGIEQAMRDITGLGGVTVLTLLTLLAATALTIRGRLRHVAVLAVAVAGGQALSNLGKFAFGRPRPDLVPHGVEVYSASFPSGHSMMAAAVYLTLAVMLSQVEPSRRMRVFYFSAAVLLTVLVGISRVYLGVHWPSDVLAGWVAGAGWALAVDLATRPLLRRA